MSVKKFCPFYELLWVFSLALAILCCCFSLRRITFTKTRVTNLADPKAFTCRHLPGFIPQDFHSPRMEALRIMLAPVVRQSRTQLEKAIAIRKWVRSLQGDDPKLWSKPFVDDTEDPYQLLAEQQAGLHSACRRFSYILTSSLLASGVDARLVHVAENFQDEGLNHTLVEAWIDSLGKWVLLDATFDTLLLVDRVPASTMDILRTVEAQKTDHISFERNGSQHLPSPSWDSYRGMFHHLYIADTNAFFEGYRLGFLASKPIRFVHFVNRHIEPYPQWRKDLLFSAAALSALVETFLLWRVWRSFRVRRFAPA